MSLPCYVSIFLTKQNSTKILLEKFMNLYNNLHFLYLKKKQINLNVKYSLGRFL